MPTETRSTAHTWQSSGTRGGDNLPLLSSPNDWLVPIAAFLQAYTNGSFWPTAVSRVGPSD